MTEEFPCNIDIIYINCIETALQLDFTIGNENISDGIIFFKTNPSFWSFGETIGVKLIELNNKSTKVEIESSANAQLITWGKNRKNETLFLECLGQILKEK